MQPSTTQKADSRFRTAFWLFLVATLFVSLTIFIATPATPAAADADFIKIFDDTGNYDFVAQGVGTRGNPDTGAWTGTGTITLTIPATATILHARLVWTGRTEEVVQDVPVYDPDGVTLSINGGAPTLINADRQYNQAPWFSNVQQVHESADIQTLVQPGNNTYTIADHEHGLDPYGTPTEGDGDQSLNYGVGIWVVYEDASAVPGEVVVYEGQDSFFRQWTPPRGPNTEVRCADFTADTENRIVEMTHFVSGVDPRGDPQTGIRSTAFWYQVGSGTKPDLSEDPGIINQPGATGYMPTDNEYPFQSKATLEWDNFDPADLSILVPAGATWACFQIESGDSQDLADLGNVGLAASGMWNFFAIKLTSPTAVTLASFTAAADTSRNVTLRWETAAEMQNFGFNLYRTDTPNFVDTVQVNGDIIPGSSSQGDVYTYSDTAPAYGVYYYWLEDVDLQGNITRHGPVTVVVSRTQSSFLPLVIKQHSP